MSTTKKRSRRKPKADSPTIKDFVSAVGFRLDCGYEHLWECYGPDACGIGWTKDDLSASSGIVYDMKTHVVYEMSVWDEMNGRYLRWIRPGFGDRYRRESIRRGHDPDVAVDKSRFKKASPAECLSALKKLVRRKLCAERAKPKWRR